MASALCQGETLAAQEISAPRAVLADSVALADSGGQRGQLGLVATEIFTDDSAVTFASAISPAGAGFGPAFASAARLPIAPAAAAPLTRHFCPPAERAPPAA